MPWTIKAKVRGLLPVGGYEFRLEEVTYKKPPEDKEYGSIMFTWKVVGGETDGQKQFQSFPLAPENIGLLAEAIGGTGAFEPEEELPDDGDTLSRILAGRLEGKSFDISYDHRKDRKSGQMWPSIKINGPSMSAFN